MTTPLPLSLYIHIPWCEKKCPYCDFNSHLASAFIDENRYIQALLKDLHQDANAFSKQIGDRSVDSIFIGGGTPSLFSAKSLSTLIRGLASCLPFADTAEITCEANPGSSEAGKFAGFRDAGINRLSIGVQSFNQPHLASLGRIHSPREAIDAVDYAQQAGFNNLNLDLMFGLPDQTTQQSLSDLQQAIALRPTHLSCYQLTIEPNTLFHHNPPVTPDDETLWEMQVALQTELLDSGYQQYEVSAYAKDNMQCRHNLNYWEFGDYLGIGAGAHGKITDANGTVTRYWKVKHPASYLKSDRTFVGGSSEVDKLQLPFEFMMNALRLSKGYSLSTFEQRTQLPSTAISHILEKHKSQNLLTIENRFVQTTHRGKQLLDSMLQDYLPDG